MFQRSREENLENQSDDSDGLRKVCRTWKSNQKIVMDEELIPNGVIDEKFVKNSLMDAKIDPKVVMDLSRFKIGGWNVLQPRIRKSLEEIS